MEFENSQSTFRQYLGRLELRESNLIGKTILDLGAGTGEFGEVANQLLDTRVISLDQVKLFHPNVQADALALPFSENIFDIVISHGSLPAVLQSISDDKSRQDAVSSLFEEAVRVLKPGGQIKMGPVPLPELEYDEERRNLNIKLLNEIKDYCYLMQEDERVRILPSTVLSLIKI